MKRLGLRRTFTDVRSARPELLRRWGVDRWPVTFMVETNEKGQVKGILDKHLGSMTPAQLIQFIRIPPPPPR